MMIQANMSPNAILVVWECTKNTFSKFNIPLISEKTLETLVAKDVLPILLAELNHLVGSSSMTCIEGG